MMINLRLRSRDNDNGGEWYDTNPHALQQARRGLTALQKAEPQNEWHLETRGTSATWHRYQD